MINIDTDVTRKIDGKIRICYPFLWRTKFHIHLAYWVIIAIPLFLLYFIFKNIFITAPLIINTTISFFILLQEKNNNDSYYENVNQYMYFFYTRGFFAALLLQEMLFATHEVGSYFKIPVHHIDTFLYVSSFVIFTIITCLVFTKKDNEGSLVSTVTPLLIVTTPLYYLLLSSNIFTNNIPINKFFHYTPFMFIVISIISFVNNKKDFSWFSILYSFFPIHYICSYSLINFIKNENTPTSNIISFVFILLYIALIYPIFHISVRYNYWPKE